MTDRRELTDEYLIARFDALCMSRDADADAIRYARDIIAADRTLQGEQDALDAAEAKMMKYLLSSAKGEAVIRLVRRLMPVFERGLDWSVFTAERAGEVNADMEALRANIAPSPNAAVSLVGYMRPDELWKAKVAPQLCRVHPEKDKHPDMVPVYMAARAAQGATE